MEWLLIWLACSVVVAIIAKSRNRSGFGWFLFSVMLSPLLGLILVVCLKEPASATATEVQSAQTIAELGLTHRLDEEDEDDSDHDDDLDLEEWRNDPATQKQYDYLFSLGWEGDQTLTKGQASKLITKLRDS